MNVINRYDYLLSILPGLEPIGSIPPMSKNEFLSIVSGANGPIKTVQAILLSDDLVQYEALLSQETDKDNIDIAVLPFEKAENTPVLPDFLLPQDSTDENQSKHLSVDGIWTRYFNHALIIAKRNHSKFLKAWIGFEVGLRNAIAATRAQTLSLDPEAYLVTPELADSGFDYSSIISSWSAAHNPLMAIEIIDKARWDWLEQNGNWYSFDKDEIEVYSAKLMILHHWRRILSDN